MTRQQQDTRRRRQRVGVDATVHQCPCEQWQLDVPFGTPIEYVKEAILEHMDECIVLAATRVAVEAAR